MQCAQRIEELKEKARQIRIDTLEMCGHVGSGHVTSGFPAQNYLWLCIMGGFYIVIPKILIGVDETILC